MRIPRDADLSLWQLFVSWAVAFVVPVIPPSPAPVHLGAQNDGIHQSSSWEEPKVHLRLDWLMAFNCLLA